MISYINDLISDYLFITLNGYDKPDLPSYKHKSKQKRDWIGHVKGQI